MFQYRKLYILLTLLFYFLLNVFSHNFSSTTKKIWLLLGATIANICCLNSYYCCCSLFKCAHQYKTFLPLQALQSTPGFLITPFSIAFQQLDYIQQGPGPFCLCAFSKQDFTCQKLQYTSSGNRGKLWSRMLLLTQSSCSLLFFTAGTLFLFQLVLFM